MGVTGRPFACREVACVTASCQHSLQKPGVCTLYTEILSVECVYLLETCLCVQKGYSAFSAAVQFGKLEVSQWFAEAGVALDEPDTVCTAVCLRFRPIRLKFTTSVTKACAQSPGAAASVSRRRRERHTLLAGGSRRASCSHTLAATRPLSACT